MDVSQLPEPPKDNDREDVWGEIVKKEDYRDLAYAELKEAELLLKAALKDEIAPHKQWYIRRACKVLGISLKGLRHDHGFPPLGVDAND